MPAARALASSAFARNGTPPDSWRTARTKASRGSDSPAATRRARIPSSLSGVSLWTWVSGALSSRSTSVAFGPVSPVVRVQATTTGRSSRRWAR